MRRPFALVLLVPSLFACGSAPAADAGPADAAQAADAGPSVCLSPREIALSVGAQRLHGDTRGRGVVLTQATCSNRAGASSAKEVLALTLPGEGPTSVQLSLRNEETSDDFIDAVLEVRTQGDCEDPTGALCFGSTLFFPAEGEPYRIHAVGSIVAQGGDTVYVVVSGDDRFDEGVWALDVTVRPHVRPVLSAASGRVVDDDRIEITVTGRDDDDNTFDLVGTFYDSDGALIRAFWVDDPSYDPLPGTPELELALPIRLVEETVVVRSGSFAGFEMFEPLRDAVRARVALVDRDGGLSEWREIDLIAANDAQLGDLCDEGQRCRAPLLECGGASCVLSTAAQAACAASEVLAIEPPGEAATTVTVSGETSPHELLYGSCVTSAPGLIYAITVPPGAHDLLLSASPATPLTGPAAVFLQATCGDLASELGCANAATDTGAGPASLELRDVAPGTYTIGVDAPLGYWGFGPISRLDLTATLRPIRESAQTCDSTFVSNRCRGEPCTGAGVCP